MTRSAVRRLFVPSLWMCLLTCTAGCVAVGGTVNKASEPTEGQQLIDLRRALDSGAVSQADYEMLKQRVINGDKPGE